MCLFMGWDAGEDRSRGVELSYMNGIEETILNAPCGFKYALDV